MPPSIPTAEPERFTAGDTVSFTLSLGDYPASAGWALSFHVKGVRGLNVNATPQGDSFLVTLPAASTAMLPAGAYQWATVVKRDLERYTVREGALVVDPDVASATDGALQPHAEKALAMIEAVLEGRLTADVQSYQLAGRLLTKIPILELKQLRREYRAELWRKRNRGRVGQRVEVTFVRR